MTAESVLSAPPQVDVGAATPSSNGLVNNVANANQQGPAVVAGRAHATASDRTVVNSTEHRGEVQPNVVAHSAAPETDLPASELDIHRLRPPHQISIDPPTQHRDSSARGRVFAAAAEPDVHISIGRIEIRTAQAPAQPIPAARVNSPKDTESRDALSLSAYLRGEHRKTS
ncbi:hypothetical protein ACXYX3_14310 [Mycobacterium sp. C3-094]